MPRLKREGFTDDQIREAYSTAGNLTEMAKILGVSYPTAAAWTTALRIPKKRQGYTAPNLAISGVQCRHAREHLRMTRDKFCEVSSAGKTALRKFELSQSTPRRATLDKILAAFKRYGIEFYSDGTFGVLKPK